MNIILARLRTTNPLTVWLVSFILGLLLIVLSMFANLSSYRIDLEGGGSREVGFLLSMNWSFGFTIVVPFVLFFLTSMRKDIEELGGRLQDNKMLVTGSYRLSENGSSIYKEKWDNLSASHFRWVLLLSIIGLALCLREWWLSSPKPIFLKATPFENKFDWTVKALSEQDVNPYINAAFSLLPFLYQSVIVFFFIYFIYLIYCFTLTIEDFTGNKSDCRIIPSLGSSDDRKGFELMETIVENCLLSTGVAYALLWLARTREIYILSDSKSQSDMLFGYLNIGGDGVKIIGKGSLLEVGGFGYTGFFVTLIALVIFCLSIFMLIVVLRRTASRSRESLRNHIKSLDDGGDYYGLIKNDGLAELDRMSVWPIRYINLNVLLIFTAMAISCLIFYKVGIYYCMLLLFAVVNKKIRKYA